MYLTEPLSVLSTQGSILHQSKLRSESGQKGSDRARDQHVPVEGCKV